MTRSLLFIYCAVFLVSAALLFVAQPMIARLVLPLFGGSPAVWTTSMLYFQLMLLAGYGYAHWLTKLTVLKTQLIVHSVLVALPLLLLPMAVPQGWTVESDSPIASLLLLLIVVSGGPFLLVTTTSPLLQRWFSQTKHPSAADPYFLYAISNFGSMVALIGYPFIAEPMLGLGNQVVWWAVTYAILVVSIISAAILTWRNRSSVAVDADSSSPDVKEPPAIPKRPSAKDRWTWILFAFLPSSWMLSTTARLTTNIAPMPLLWIIPLSLYLLTFILVFAKRKVIPHDWILRLLPFAILLLTVSILVTGRWQLMLIEIAAFFLTTMACHGELAKRRPPAQHLTEFYLMMSIGGALGGMFNAVLAPLVFSVYLEFPIVVAITCWIRPEPAEPDEADHSRIDMFLLLGTTLLIGLLLRSFSIEKSVPMTMIVVGAIPVLVVLQFWGFAKYSGIVLLFVFVWDQFDPGSNYIVVERARSFFGVHTVVDDIERPDIETGQPLARYRRLMHGTTQHGCQSLDETRQREPLAYYHPTGPLGDVFKIFAAPAEDSPQQIAVIGLGTGAMAAYASKERRFTFYEIDPVVQRLAGGSDSSQESPLFNYLKLFDQQKQKIIVGDGRLELAKSDDGAFELVVLDAFSSDAIPTHLLTTEAIQMYFNKTIATGAVVFHISNRYLDLSTVLAANAKQLGVDAYIRRDLPANDKELDRLARLGIETSTYVIMAREKEHLRTLTSDRYRWQPLQPSSTSVVWSDDFSNILSVLRWDPRSVTLGTN